MRAGAEGAVTQLLSQANRFDADASITCTVASLWCEGSPTLPSGRPGTRVPFDYESFTESLLDADI